MRKVRLYRLLLAFVAHVIPGSGHADAEDIGREDWTSFTGGELNISAFAFRDVDRDGIYGLSDHPMAGVAFDAIGGGRTVTRRTNKSGFANFNMSVNRRESDIINMGKYTFVASTPSGWLITSNNALQTTSFHLMPGAPADMISSTPMQAVGLAPELRLRGRLRVVDRAPQEPSSVPAGSDELWLKVMSPGGVTARVPVDPQGFFSFPASRGGWTISPQRGDGRIAEQPVDVSTSPVQLGALAGNGPRPDGLRFLEASFDDLITAGVKEIPNGYAGLSWRNWVATHNKFYDGEGYVNTTTSGEFVAYNSSGHPVRIEHTRPFSFVGGDFGSAWLRAEGETLQVQAWRGSDLAYEDEIELSAFGPVHYVAGFENVTAIEFRTSRYWQFVCDSLIFGMSQ